MRKRIKLPPTIRVHLIDEKNVQVFGRRLKDNERNQLQTVLKQPKRRLKYTVPYEPGLLEDYAKNKDYSYEGIPKHVAELLTHLKERTLDPFETKGKDAFNSFWPGLHPHQKEGVKQIVQYYKGRALLADDMGLGKTHQAIALIMYYMHEGPSIVVCPSYLCAHWKHALGDLDVTVISYDMLPKKNLGPFNMLVCDESHYIKNRKAKRTVAVQKIKSRRAIFMTGTPALNRPIELFSQLHILRPSFVKNYSYFAKRYCDGKVTQFGYDDRGHSCDEELHWLLKKVYMLRRLKRDIINLPMKTRHAIMMDIEDLTELQEKIKEWKQMTELHEIKAIMSEMFRMTAKTKIKAMKAWVKDLVRQGHTFIFFAYHRHTLDAIQEVCHDYIRIDGSTPAPQRQELVEAFQRGEKRVALLSIMAAGTGLTLTKASIVVFGELYWVPGVMLQAEDRVHRLSQTNPVNIYHLIGKGTLDTHIYSKLISKLKTLDALVDNRNDRTLQGK